MTSVIDPLVASLRAAFASVSEPTVGFEEEVMVLGGETYDLAPTGAQVVAALNDDRRFKLELPASQVEITGTPSVSVRDLGDQLLEARRKLVSSCGHFARFACAGVHPFTSEEGIMNRGGRYDWTVQHYGPLARRQLVCALQVHVAVPGADRVLPVYNAMRSHLPDLLAVSANAPIYRGTETGLATVRPLIAELLPRQGVPPILASWEHYAASLDWCTRTGALPSPALWWWELRPHATYGTLEVRVPDAQTSVRAGAALFALVQSLVVWLGERHVSNDLPSPTETWRIEENRWSALIHGTRGQMVDLETGRLKPTDERLHDLLDDLRETADALGNRRQLEDVRAMIDRPNWLRQIDILRAGTARDVVEHLSEEFLSRN